MSAASVGAEAVKAILRPIAAAAPAVDDPMAPSTVSRAITARDERLGGAGRREQDRLVGAGRQVGGHTSGKRLRQGPVGGHGLHPEALDCAGLLPAVVPRSPIAAAGPTRPRVRRARPRPAQPPTHRCSGVRSTGRSAALNAVAVAGPTAATRVSAGTAGDRARWPARSMTASTALTEVNPTQLNSPSDSAITAASREPRSARWGDLDHRDRLRDGTFAGQQGDE